MSGWRSRTCRTLERGARSEERGRVVEYPYRHCRCSSEFDGNAVESEKNDVLRSFS